MSDRHGIEIDYCPKCRGVWLDRGELDKIIERSAAMAPEPVSRQESVLERAHRPHYPEHGRDTDYGYRGDNRHKKRRGFLGDLFDFD